MRITFFLLLVAASLFGQQKSNTTQAGPAKRQPSVKTTPAAPSNSTPATSSSSPGMQIYRDPVTGQMEAPPPGASLSTSSLLRSVPEAPIVTQNPDGSLTALLPDSMMVQVTVSKNPDGTLSLHEAQPQSAPQAALAESPKLEVKK